jgi:hypothetical protein
LKAAQTGSSLFPEPIPGIRMRNQSISMFLLWLLPVVVSGFNSNFNSPLSLHTSSCRRPYGCYAVTKDKEKTDNAVVNADPINGTPEPKAADDSKSEDSFFQDFNASHYTESVVSNITEVMDEISQRINDGSMELFANLTMVMDGKLADQLPDSAVSELTEYISGIAKKLQKTQQQELERQLGELEKRFVEPFEQIAFSDAPLFDMNKKVPKTKEQLEREQAKRRRAIQNELVLRGANSTLTKSARMKSRELVSNFNVAPLYYSVALLYRWAQKASYPSVLLISAFKGMASVVKTKGGPNKKKRKGEVSYEEYMKDAEAMQSGWKKIGQIAAKGSAGKKWAILRRSAEVWAYFSSFYLKDRRITNKYQSGQWSEEKFAEERSKLGAEITQNLLRLGPTFIKVWNECARKSISLLLKGANNFIFFRWDNFSRLGLTLFRRSTSSN